MKWWRYSSLPLIQERGTWTHPETQTELVVTYLLYRNKTIERRNKIIWETRILCRWYNTPSGSPETTRVHFSLSLGTGCRELGVGCRLWLNGRCTHSVEVTLRKSGVTSTRSTTPYLDSVQCRWFETDLTSTHSWYLLKIIKSHNSRPPLNNISFSSNCIYPPFLVL